MNYDDIPADVANSLNRLATAQRPKPNPALQAWFVNPNSQAAPEAEHPNLAASMSLGHDSAAVAVTSYRIRSKQFSSRASTRFSQMSTGSKVAAGAWALALCCAAALGLVLAAPQLLSGSSPASDVRPLSHHPVPHVRSIHSHHHAHHAGDFAYSHAKRTP